MPAPSRPDVLQTGHWTIGVRGTPPHRPTVPAWQKPPRAPEARPLPHTLRSRKNGALELGVDSMRYSLDHSYAVRERIAV